MIPLDPEALAFAEEYATTMMPWMPPTRMNILIESAIKAYIERKEEIDAGIPSS